MISSVYICRFYKCVYFLRDYRTLLSGLVIVCTSIGFVLWYAFGRDVDYTMTEFDTGSISSSTEARLSESQLSIKVLQILILLTENPFYDLFIATGSAIFVEDIETTFANTNQNDIKNQLREVKALIVDKDIMEKKGNATF